MPDALFVIYWFQQSKPFSLYKDASDCALLFTSNHSDAMVLLRVNKQDMQHKQFVGTDKVVLVPDPTEPRRQAFSCFTTPLARCSQFPCRIATARPNEPPRATMSGSAGGAIAAKRTPNRAATHAQRGKLRVRSRARLSNWPRHHGRGWHGTRRRRRIRGTPPLTEQPESEIGLNLSRTLPSAGVDLFSSAPPHLPANWS